MITNRKRAADTDASTALTAPTSTEPKGTAVTQPIHTPTTPDEYGLTDIDYLDICSITPTWWRGLLRAWGNAGVRS